MNNAEIVIENQKIRGIWRDDADESVWAEIFKYREYRVADDAIMQAKTIFDIGAHAGFFTLYTRALNASAQIVALEPCEENIEALSQNLKLNNFQTNIKVVSGALAPRVGKYVLQLEDDSHNHKIVSENKKDLKKTNRPIKTYTLGELLELTSKKIIDVLKMDIEGVEKDILVVFGGNDWESVRNIVLEYHGGSGQSSRVEGILRKNGFSVKVFPSQFDKTMGIIFGRNRR